MDLNFFPNFPFKLNGATHNDQQPRCKLNACLDCSLSGRIEESPCSLSSPTMETPLDSPLSCADLTLDTTGELTVEDVRDFLT